MFQGVDAHQVSAGILFANGPFSKKKKSCEPTRSLGVRGCDSLADIGVAVHLDCAGLYTIDLNTISWNHLPCMVPGKIWSKQE